MTESPPTVIDRAQAIGSRTAYAGFWLRFVACIIDSLIAPVLAIPVALIGAIPYVFFQAAAMSDSNEVMTGMAVAYTAVYGFAIVASGFFYFVVFECSKLQATPGKLALGLIVTDEREQRITFLRSVGRNAGKFISAVCLCMGFIIAGFTKRKQALHDLIASCLVMRKAPEITPIQITMAVPSDGMTTSPATESSSGTEGMTTSPATESITTHSTTASEPSNPNVVVAPEEIR